MPPSGAASEGHGRNPMDFESATTAVTRQEIVHPD